VAKTGKAKSRKAPAKKTATEQAKNRAGGGKFAPGASGNPGGRPALPPELKEAARAMSPEALNILAKIMRNAKAPAAARVRAAESIMNRAYGTPPASVEVTNISDLPRIVIEAST
jgi:hypothetical protein